MTSTKIEKILEENFDISDALDKWLKLAPQVSIISLDQDANIYIDKDQYFYFDTDEELVTIARKTLSGTYKPEAIFDMNYIRGFISSAVLGPAGVYVKL